jgi:prepilin-type N-terminal cleavage/methylation domain-containing protein
MQATRRRPTARARTRNRRLSGMTLIEVMIVMVIMALVAVAAGFAVMPAVDRTRVRQAQTDASTIRQMAIAYQLEQSGACPTLQDLVDMQIQSASTTSGDPWGTPFVIECGEAEPTVISAGRDKQLNTEDDIS